MSNTDYFDWHYKFSSFFLLIPPEKLILKVPYWIFVVPHSILICLSAVLETTKLCLGGSGDFSSNILNLGVAVLHFIGVNRVARWLFIKKDYDAVIEQARKINLNFSEFGIVRALGGREWDVHRKSNPIEKYQGQKMHQTKLYCQKLCISFVAYVSLNLSISYTLNYRNPSYEKWNPLLNKTSLYRDYPYPLWYPFDTSISDGYYWWGFFYQPYAFLFLMSGFFWVDFLCVNTVIHLTSHVNVLGHAFSYIDKNIDPLLDRNESLKLKEKRLTTLVKELQEIYKCAKMLNDLISAQLLFQELAMAVTLCCSVYRVTSATYLGPEVGYLSSMVAVCAAEVFTVCWFNQAFTLELFDLVQRVYELDWINYPPELRKTLVFLMKRFQTPFYFTLGSWLQVDVGVFLLIIKTSYSFYTLITQSGSKLTKSHA